MHSSQLQNCLSSLLYLSVFLITLWVSVAKDHELHNSQYTLRPPEVHIRSVHFNVNVQFNCMVPMDMHAMHMVLK